MLLFRGWSIELGPVSRRYIAWSQNYFTHILSLANDKIYGLHYFPEPKRLQAKFSTCSSYNRQKQHRRNRNWAHKCIYFYTTLDGWMDKQTGSKSDKKYINVILLTFLSIKSKTISAIAKHIIRLGHHYYRSLCTHIPSVCGSVQYVWSFGDISSGRALFGAVWTDKKPEMWGWCGLGHADCTELTPGLIKFSSAACNRWVQEIWWALSHQTLYSHHLTTKCLTWV